MYENQLQTIGAASGYADAVCAQAKQPYKSPTLAENIDQRITMLKEHVERLEKVKALLSEPTGILNVPLDDLRFAMNY